MIRSSVLLAVILLMQASIAVGSDDSWSEESCRARLTNSDHKERLIATQCYYNHRKDKEIPKNVIKILVEACIMDMQNDKRYHDYLHNKEYLKKKIPEDLKYINTPEYAEARCMNCELAAKSRDKRVLPYHCSAPDAIGYFGDEGVDYLLKSIESDNTYRTEILRISDIAAIKGMLNQTSSVYKIQGTKRKEVREFLIKHFKKEKSWRVKTMILMTFGEMGDEDLVPLLEEISKHDKDVIKRQDGTEFYPVRHEAQKVLDRIKGAKPEKPGKPEKSEPPAITNQPAP